MGKKKKNLNKDELQTKNTLRDIVEDLDLDTIANQVKTNYLIFKENKINYKVNMPTPKEENTAIDARNKFHTKLLMDKDYLTREQLQIAYKNKGIDIEAMEKQFADNQRELTEQYIKLAKTPQKDERGINYLKKVIEEIKDKQYVIAVKKTKLFECSIETRINQFYIQYLASLCTVKEIEKDKWEVVWKTFEDFEQDTTRLSIKAVAMMTTLMMGLRTV